LTPRHVVLTIAAVAVLGMGVYLFVQVRATPAQAETPPIARPTSSSQPVAARPDPAGHSAPAHTQPAPPSPVVEAPTPPDDQKANPHLDATMDQANKAYDHQDYDEAKAIAGKVLATQPDNIRMMRIMVSSSCIDGDMAVAQTYYDKLPKVDREQMKARCDRYGVAFKEPAQ
jgi:hypothetical protein